jgi:hypothetical protein
MALFCPAIAGRKSLFYNRLRNDPHVLHEQKNSASDMPLAERTGASARATGFCPDPSTPQ